MDKSHKSPLSLQIDALSKYLEQVKKQDIFDFSQRIYPVNSSLEPYICLYSAIKKQALSAKSKGVNLGQFANDLIAKAYMAGEFIGNKFAKLIKEEPQFLIRLDPSSNLNAVNSQKSIQQHEEKKQIASSVNSLQIPQKNIEVNFQRKFPLKQKPLPAVQRLTPVSSPLRSSEFMFDSPIIHSKSPQAQAKQPVAFSYKIGGPRPTENNNSGMTATNANTNKKVSPWAQKFNDLQKQQDKAYERIKSGLQQKIESLKEKNKNNIQKILNLVEDPLSSARPATLSPSKPIFASINGFNNLYSNPKPYQIPNFPPPQTQTQLQTQQSKLPFVYPPPISKPKQSFSRNTDSLYNLSNKKQCLCQTSCDNITMSEDSFSCLHCGNVYHTRCMRKQTDSRNCVICHLRMMTPNRLVTQQIFVGLMKKNKKKHQIIFQLSQTMFSFIKAKKDFTYKLTLRCFRLKSQTQNQNLFPDSCSIFINGKQLKQFKPLHKQSCLKYRRDEVVPILKYYTPGENKITIQEYHSSNGIDRVQPEDHLIGLYLVEDEALNSTVQRIIKNHVTELRQSKALLNKAFNMGDKGNKSSEEMSQEQAITCQVIKIPLTCALTTQKLNYPARGVFCKHFQCFDLKNYIMMTSSSSNPRWVCPICKTSCYEFRIDCILTEILNQYTGCDKVDVLVLYKEGMYQVIDRDQDAIDSKGNKLKNPQPKDIADLKIIDKLKRDRQDQAQREYLEQQSGEKKKKKIVQLPPEDQIVCLLSDED